MIERLISNAFAKPGLVVAVVLGAAGSCVWLRDLPRDVFPISLRPSSTSSCRIPRWRSRNWRPASDSDGGCARWPSERASHPVHVAARRDASDDRVRARCGLLPLPPARGGTRDPSAGQMPPGPTRRWSRVSPDASMKCLRSLGGGPGAADLMALRDLAEFDVKNRLLAVPGVAAIERLGGYLRQFQVQLDPSGWRHVA